MFQLVRGDCLDVLPTFGAETIDVVMTSPPYNLGIAYKSYNDKLPRAGYLAWSRLWLDAVKRVLAAHGSLFLNMGGKPTDPWPPYEVLNVAREAGYVLQNTLYWIKSFSENGAPCEGHVKPINSERFVNDAVEFVFHLTHRGDVQLDKRAPGVGVPFADESNLERDGRGKHGNIRCRGNALLIAYKTIQSRDKDRPHPATFPPELAEYCFRLHGLERCGLTCDPFTGLGSTAWAARKLGLAHLGIEIDAHYHAEACARLGIVPGTVAAPPATSPLVGVQKTDHLSEF
jgi:site-specific DNA-methyltransferase (adenine-specific)